MGTALAERVPPHLLAGPLGEALGAQAVLAAGTAAATLALAAGLLVRETRTLRRPERRVAA